MKKRYYNWFMNQLPQRHWNFIQFWGRFLPLQPRLATEFVFILPLPPKCLNCKHVSPCLAPHRALYIFLFLLVIWEFCAVCFDHIPRPHPLQLFPDQFPPWPSTQLCVLLKTTSKTSLYCVNILGLTRGYTLRENWLCSQQLTVPSNSSFLGWDFMPRVPLHAGIWFSFGLHRSCVCHHKLLWIHMGSFLLWQKILFPHSHSSPLVLKLILLLLLLLWALSLRRRGCSIYVSFRVEHSTVSYFLCLAQLRGLSHDLLQTDALIYGHND